MYKKQKVVLHAIMSEKKIAVIAMVTEHVAIAMAARK